MTPEEIDRIAVAYHNDGDDDTVPWGKQKSNYRGRMRKMTREMIAAIEECGFATVPRSALSTAPASAAEPVRIKQLEWLETSHDDHLNGTTSKASTPFGEYAITSWSTGEWRVMYGPARGWEGRGTKKELQSAAQTDFEARIKLAIDT